MKKVLCMLLVVILLVSLSLVGCGNKNVSTNTSSDNTTVADSSEKATSTQTAALEPVSLRIAWWGNQTRNDRTQKVMDLYHQNNPNITLQGEYVDWGGYWQKLATQAAASSLPDIIQMDYSYIDQYSVKNLLLDLTPYTSNGLLDVSDVSPNILSSGKINNGLFGISLGTNTLSMTYDPEVFRLAGVEEPTAQWTWQQYEDILTRVHDATGKQADPFWSYDPIIQVEYIARQHGFSLYNADGKSLGFTDVAIPQFVFDQVDRLTRAKVYMSPDKVPAGTAIEDQTFTKGESFFSWINSNGYVALMNASKRPVKMISLPLGGTSMGLYNKPAMFFSVASSSQYKDESVKFASYFINDLDANKILLAERGVPVVTKIRTELKGSVNEATAATFDYIETVNNIDKVVGPIDAPAPASGSEVSKLMKDLYDKVSFGRLKPDEASTQFMQQANDILAKAE